MDEKHFSADVVHGETLNQQQLLKQLAECQADKEFVWSLWRELQSSAPDKTKLISLVVTREKEKANRALQNLQEANRDSEAKLADMVQTVAVQKQELQASHSREHELRRQLSVSQQLQATSHVVQQDAVNIDSLRSQLEEEAHQKQALQKQLFQVAAQSESLAVQVQEHVKAEKEQARELVKLQVANERVSRELQETKESHRALESHTERVLNEVVTKLEASDAELRSTKVHLSNVRQSHDDARQRLSKTESECSQLRDVLKSSAAAHCREKEQLKQALGQAKQRLEREQKYRQQLRVKFSEMQTQMDKLQDQQAKIAAEQVTVAENTSPTSTPDEPSHSAALSEAGNTQSAALPDSPTDIVYVSSATQTSPVEDYNHAGNSIKNKELLELRAAHGRRLQRYQSLLEDHRLLQEQLKTYDSDLVKDQTTRNEALNRPVHQQDGRPEATDPWYLQQEDLHGAAPWNELRQARKTCTALKKQIDLVEEERDTLLVTSAQLASQLKEDKHWPVCTSLEKTHVSTQTSAESSTRISPEQSKRLHMCDASTSADLCSQETEEVVNAMRVGIVDLEAKLRSQQRQLDTAETELRTRQAHAVTLTAEIVKLQTKLLANRELTSSQQASVKDSANETERVFPDVVSATHRRITKRAQSLSPLAQGNRPVSMVTETRTRGCQVEHVHCSGRRHRVDFRDFKQFSPESCCCADGRDYNALGCSSKPHNLGRHRRSRSLGSLDTDDPPSACHRNGECARRKVEGRLCCSECSSASCHARKLAIPVFPVAFGSHYKDQCQSDTGHGKLSGTPSRRRFARKRSKSLSDAPRLSAPRSAALSREISVLRAECSTLRQSAQQSTQEVEDLRRSLLTCRSKLAVSQATIKRLQADLVSRPNVFLSRPPHHGDAYVVVTEEPADQDSSSIAVLTAQLRQKSDKEKSLLTDVSRQLATIRRLRTDQEVHVNTISQLKARCTALDRDVRQKQVLLKSLRQTQISAQHGAKQANIELKAVEEKLKSRVDEIAMLKMKMSSVQRSLETERNQKKAMQSKLHCCLSDIATKQEEVQRLKAKVREERELAAESEEALGSLLKKTMHAEEGYRRSLGKMQQAVEASHTQLEQYKDMVKVVFTRKQVVPDRPPSTDDQVNLSDSASADPAVDRQFNMEAKSLTSDDFSTPPIIMGNTSDETKTRSSAWLKACQLSCSILELSASELSDLIHET